MSILPFLATLNLDKHQRKLLRNFEGTLPVRKVSIATNLVHVKTAMIDALAQTIKQSVPEILLKSEGEVIAI
tara:strand:- start:97 stop:312 length:216 start_codon:yes stop_codon:yes gene_type:complete